MAGALAGVCKSSWPAVAWKFSNLNGDGFPVSFTFSSARSGIRYAAEIAGPETEERERLRRALEWVGWFGPAVAAEVEALQPAKLRWGAWVGGFHSETDSRRKVYVEAASTPPLLAEPSLGLQSGQPCRSDRTWRTLQRAASTIVSTHDLAACGDMAPTALSRPVVLPPGSELRFVGLADGGTDREYYLRRDFLELAEAGKLLCSLSLQECFQPICEAIAAALPWPGHEHLIPTDSGFSIALGGGGRAVSIYTFARSLWGGDGSIRKHILELAAKNGWDFRLYEEVSRPLESVTGCRTCHGILAWVAVPGRPVELRIDLRPPAPRRDAEHAE